MIPAPLKDRFVSKASKRAETVDTNIRLLTVLSLLQNVRLSPSGVPQGFKLYGDHWYRLYKVDLQWVPAENFCRSLGGHLTSIQDPAENEFVHQLRESESQLP